MQKPNVKVIPAIEPVYAGMSSEYIARKRRTAGYARVSTDKDEQLNSQEAQVDYYTNYIKSRPDWEFISVYVDEGISATSTAKREGFKKMIADALAGKIDLIITKSVSRFARNTVDSLSTIRDLKEVGCEVFFEKEGIWTFDGKGELLITIMSSLAQEESRSISENVRWGQRKRMADGKVSLLYGMMTAQAVKISRILISPARRASGAAKPSASKAGHGSRMCVRANQARPTHFSRDAMEGGRR